MVETVALSLRSWLEQMNPKLIIIGEAPSIHLNYYVSYDTITQNSAGDITLDCEPGQTHRLCVRSRLLC